MSEKGLHDLTKRSDSVYLAHQAGLKLPDIHPTRQLIKVISRHKDCEDAQYALGSGRSNQQATLIFLTGQQWIY